MKNHDFLGRGLGFPPTFDKRKKDFVTVAGEEDIQQSLHIILATELGERMLNPDFGSNLRPLVFESLDLSLRSLMRDTIHTALIFHEPRIQVHNVQIKEGEAWEGKVLIQVDYSVRSTNTRFNFVYPFYLEEGTDIDRRA